jgi:DtxR family Mn-dependent transcriptional regulator
VADSNEMPMAEHTITDSIQDYLKHIYELTEGGRSASTNALAARLRIRPASVTGMMQKLAAAHPALVTYHKHQGVTLTRQGRLSALEVIRHHRLIEAWLVQNLGYTWDEVHEEAERLEHVISEDLEQRISAALGNPSRDPHGELIPTAGLSMPKEHSLPLSALRDGQTARVRSVKAADTGLLKHLQSLGLLPGARLRVLTHSTYDANLTVKVGRRVHVLGLPITTKVYVERED